MLYKVVTICEWLLQKKKSNEIEKLLERIQVFKLYMYDQLIVSDKNYC